ncbi:hypothetical protein Q31b_42960 [Novipirellula aureliae]|uniref:Plasmid related protein n=1 Tax=Novipirellula aureliae TaxID=2527966 RepID=A0A5C6DL60_9BACT|nr:hypothetical protein [Novipirellula aureliae]TWU37508.1 hypothetical protein Q31b_42960 [Novipirellula aureliae]
MKLAFDPQRKVPVGIVYATATVARQLDRIDVLKALDRHQDGDWGLVSESDATENEFVLINGLRLLSVFEDRKGVRFWIITEADRSYTTVLFPSDY